MKPPRAQPAACTAAALRREIGARHAARAPGFAHEITLSRDPSLLYRAAAGRHGNFLDASYRAVLAHPAWSARLGKTYTAYRDLPRDPERRPGRRRFELDCAHSSDALLMNVFCYPRLLHRAPLCALLGIEPGIGSAPEFGHRPQIRLRNGHLDRTEIDLRLADRLIEAKLTEGDFQRAPLDRVRNYPGFETLFDPARLRITAGVVHSYQLIRGALIAAATGRWFVVLCDRRRPDLVERWFEVIAAVADSDLRRRLGLLTWQELAATLPAPLREFLDLNYGIYP